MSQILATIATVPDRNNSYVMHLVTMQSPDMMDEITLWVWTETSAFSDVLRECKRVIAVAWLEDGLDYRGYWFFESFEVVDRTASAGILDKTSSGGSNGIQSNFGERARAVAAALAT